MKNSTTCGKKLTSLLKKIDGAEPPQLPESKDPVAVTVFSFLVWETSTRKAMTAYNRLMTQVVDFNDLRVCMPFEMEEHIGVRYPAASERCQRLRAVLHDIYNREHAVTLDHLAEMNKRDVKKYVESLEGIVPYVSSRLLLISFDTHGMPVDEQLRQCLVDAKAADASADVDEVGAWLTRQVKSGEGVATHFALQAWAEEGGDGAAKPARKPRSTKPSSTKKKTTKKTATRASNGRTAKRTSKSR